jgi:hypothetical protein
MGRVVLASAVAFLVAAGACGRGSSGDGGDGPSFSAAGDAALGTVERAFYDGSGGWTLCVPDVGCGASDSDWGSDSLTYALSFRWKLTHDPGIPPMLSALNAAGPTYGSCRAGTCTGWSDVPLWDSVAASREYAVTNEASALARAQAAFDFVDGSDAFAIGACPTIDYQQPGGGANQLKTLETDSNYVVAALLLFEETAQEDYVARALARYASIRQYFLDPDVPLYTVYVVDTGAACTAIPRRFFASVNGNMILGGLMLAEATGDPRYRDQAIATATELDSAMSDPGGIYENLQAENDTAEPLVEAFYRLATTETQAFAGAWILRNAAAVARDVASSGSYGRFWGGPAPTGTTTAWQATGGLALAFAAAALAPSAGSTERDVWKDAASTTFDVTTLPATIQVSGSAVALFGTIGEQCCDGGHARVFVDGVETFDQTGIWQNKSSSGRSLPDSVLFAWRWPTSAAHTIELQPGVPNAKEGASFLHVQRYEVAP